MAIVALLGRPNVGKSSLFNRLTRTRDALVADIAGLTRDRQFGQVLHEDQSLTVVDTGGLGVARGALADQIGEQAKLAARNADMTLLLTDYSQGLTTTDADIARYLRQTGRPVLLAVNKAEGIDAQQAVSEFHALGLGEPIAISALRGTGIPRLLHRLFATLPRDDVQASAYPGIRTAIVGRPNTGKSTLINTLVGEDRVIASELPGTTRDSIEVPFEYLGEAFVLIDTAGVRRRARVTEVIEKLSIVKTLQAIEDAQVAIVLIDTVEGVADQDLHLIFQVLEQGRALVLALNKWDLADSDQKQRTLRELSRRGEFVAWADRHEISALRGGGLQPLMRSVTRAYRNATREFSTNKLTELLDRFQRRNPAPAVHGRRIKLRYAHQGGRNPPVIVVHGNQTAALSVQYQRYLANAYRDTLDLKGTPVRIICKEGHNPYEGRRNLLTPRQVKKKQRQQRHFRK